MRPPVHVGCFCPVCLGIAGAPEILVEEIAFPQTEGQRLWVEACERRAGRRGGLSTNSNGGLLAHGESFGKSNRA